MIPGGAGYRPKVPYDWEHRQRWQRLPFPVAEYRARVAEVQRRMGVEGLDALLIYGCPGDDASVRWLTNFDAGGAQSLILVPVGGEPVLFSTWVLHGEPMHSMYWQTWLQEAVPAAPAPGPALRAGELLASSGRVGVAGWSLLPQTWMEALSSHAPRVAFEAADRLLLELRAVKSAAEVAKLRRSAEIAGEAMRVAMAACRPGTTEHEVAAAAHEVIYRLGAEGPAFDCAVVAGPRAGLKHGGPSERPMAKGDMVFLDLGAKLDGYHSDLSRTFVLGEPSAPQLLLLQTAERMFEAFLKAGRPGSVVADLQRLGERIALDAGLEADYMPQGWGHGLGTHLFELPSLAYGAVDVLEPGMVFALEPMLVRLGVGTAVMEETVLVTETGLETLSGLMVSLYL